MNQGWWKTRLRLNKQLGYPLPETTVRIEPMVIDQDGLLEQVGPDMYRTMQINSAYVNIMKAIRTQQGFDNTMYEIERYFTRDECISIMMQLFDSAAKREEQRRYQNDEEL